MKPSTYFMRKGSLSSHNAEIRSYVGTIKRAVSRWALILLAVTIAVTGNLSLSESTRASATSPPADYGLAAMSNIDQLPQLSQNTLAGGQSSFNRNTQDASHGNNDYGNFLYTSNGENVMLDQNGPGVVDRIWMTGFVPSTDWIKVYFDGETTPRINMLLQDFFSGTHAPFLAPLVANDTTYSGGYVNYVPLPYAKSIKITTNMKKYYNVGYHTLSPDTVVTTWTGQEDSSTVREQWENAGVDPKDTSADTVESGMVNLPANDERTILDIDGPRQVDSLRLHLSSVTPSSTVSDDGRAYTGYSQFTVAIDPGNSKVILRRRFDYGVANQKAVVYVDGVNAGTWYDAGSDTTNYHFRSSGFVVPSSLTAGKSSITVKVQFVSSANDWNEFTYWVDSVIGTSSIQTDEVNIGNVASEQAHHYIVSGQTWSGSRSFVEMPEPVDDGRAFKGYSQFVMAIDPNNTSVSLVRRFDYGVANQKAVVYVDGVNAGTWYDAGSSNTYHWRDSSFVIPSSLTAGKSSITVKVQFVSSANDWNEFTYWTYSATGDRTSLSDTLDVANPASESQHQYVVNTPTWTGFRSFIYDTAALLNSTYLRMYWDNETEPSVDAPLGSFFSMGQYGAYATHGLVVGMDAANMLYVYLPMPFGQHARIQLVNEGARDTSGISYEVKYRPLSGDMSNLGYFHTQVKTTNASGGQDLPILDTGGAGTFIGVTASYAGASTSRFYLEGDERIYVDGSMTPAFYGTGTEDFFNGGWYFQHGPYSAPLSGNTAHIITSTSDITAAYRFFLQDAVPFHDHITVSIQHGAYDEAGVTATTLAYYYQQPADTLVLSDRLDVANAASEASHQYTISSQTWTGTRTFQYDGTADATNITDDGRAHVGTSQFVMNVSPTNHGVILRRRFDQSVANQQAYVYIDGQLVGPWYVAGSDPYHRWRDGDFMIPASFTEGKTSVTVTIRFISSAIDWNEFAYDVYSFTR